MADGTRSDEASAFLSGTVVYQAVATRAALTHRPVARTMLMVNGKHYSIVAFDELAKELAAVQKGSVVQVVGSLEHTEQEIGRGQKHYISMQVNVKKIKVCQTPLRSFGSSVTNKAPK